MRTILLAVGILSSSFFCLNTAYGQKSASSPENHWQKVYILDDTLWVAKPTYTEEVTDLYAVVPASRSVHRMSMVRHVLDGKPISHLCWDMDLEYLISIVPYGFTPDEVHFMRKKEWNQSQTYQALEQSIQEATDTSTRCDLLRHKQAWYERHILSRTLNGHEALADKIHQRSLTASQKKPSAGASFTYDLLLGKNRTLHIPYICQDSLFWYTFPHKYWRQLTYEGTRTRAGEGFTDPRTQQKDVWMPRESVPCPFSGNFRAVQMDSAVYFITGWNAQNKAQLFEYHAQAFRKIGTLSKPAGSTTMLSQLLLIDKDAQKIWCLPPVTFQSETTTHLAIGILSEKKPIYLLLKALNSIDYIDHYIKL